MNEAAGAETATLRTRENLLARARGLMETVRERSEETEETRRLAPETMQAMREAGIQRMHDELRPGMTERELWSWLHYENIRNGGEWIETRLLSSGPRTNPWFRESSMRVIERGDMVSFDTDLVGPYGYCCDISRSWVCDAEPNDEQRRIYADAYAPDRDEHRLFRHGPASNGRTGDHGPSDAVAGRLLQPRRLAVAEVRNCAQRLGGYHRHRY